MPEHEPDSPEILNLLALFRSDPAAAFKKFQEDFSPFLLRIVELRMNPLLRSRLDPADVVQESLLEIVRRVSVYLERRPMPFRLWVRQAVLERLGKLHRQHLQTQRRAIGREVSLPAHSSWLLAQCLHARGLSPSGEVNQVEIVRCVRAALDELPAADREVLLLRTVEGLSNGEIAFQLGAGTTADAVSKRYGRALLRLGKRLRENGFGGSGS
jgi:RNA polymerase sigma-70 factor (ECF subfamily)